MAVWALMNCAVKTVAGRKRQIEADLSLDKQMLQDVLKKMPEYPAAAGTGQLPIDRLPGIDMKSLFPSPSTEYHILKHRPESHDWYWKANEQ
jgi:hypothetical protein